MESSSGVGGSSTRPPPLPVALPTQQPTAIASTPQPLLPNSTALPSHHHPHEKLKSRPKSPAQVHEKPPSLHQQHARSAVPARAKSPLSVATLVPPSVCKKSESPHQGRTKSSTVSVTDMCAPSRNGTAVPEVKPTVDARSRRPEAHVAKPVLAVDQQSVTVRSETEMLPQTPSNISCGSQKSGTVASLPNVPDKTGTPVQRESPYSRSSKSKQRTPPPSGNKKTPASLPEILSAPVSPFGSPPPPTPTTPNKTQGSLRATRRHRTSSSSSEPELVPVVKKLDEIAGYENIIRDSKMGIKLPNRVPDIIPPIRDRNKKDETSVAASATGNNHNSSSSVMLSVAKELKTPDLIRPFATKISDSLSQTAKSASFPDDLGAVAFPDSDPTNGTYVRTQIQAPPVASEEALGSADIQSVGIIDISTMEEHVQPLENVVSSACSSLLMSEHHRKSEKKKKKKEHKEHKHKERDKNREERRHRHKHKDKDKDRHKGEKADSSAPIKITIPKDKINLSSTLEPVAGTGLKIKIQKDRLKGGSDSTGSSPQSAPSGGLKIKISKEVIGNFNNSNTGPPGFSSEAPSSSRKRDRSIPQSSELVLPPAPPAKKVRPNASLGDERRSGSNFNNYGRHNGVEHHRRGMHYPTSGGKVRGGIDGPRGNCYMTPTLPMQQLHLYRPYPPYYQAFPPPPPGIVPQSYMYGYYPPPTTYMYHPPLPAGPAPEVMQPHEPPPLPEGPPPDNPPPPPPPE